VAAGAANLGAVYINLTAEEIAELARLTAPAPIYPNWFNKRTSDVPVTQALVAKATA
jgi:hypothetical protein